jgi:hypothetical protein
MVRLKVSQKGVKVNVAVKQGLSSLKKEQRHCRSSPFNPFRSTVPPPVNQNHY